MISTLRNIAGAACLLCCASISAAQDLPGWSFAWEDVFNGSSVDTARWDVLEREDSFNNEKQYYHPGQVDVSSGNLVITADDQPLGSKQYRSGLVRTWGEQTYGRWEVRAKLPTTQGMWPAIWLLPRTAPWPTGGEIDIMENRGSQPGLVSSAYHWGPSWPSNFIYDQFTGAGLPANYHDAFHTYAVEWEPDQISYYVDGVHHFTVHESVAPVSSTPMSLIINVAVGGDFGGDPDGSTVFPQEMLVDYVRVWDHNPATELGGLSGNLLGNTSFEDDGGTLNGWGVFGNDIGNVSASSEYALDGVASTKVYGQFSGGANYSGIVQGIAASEGDRVRAAIDSFLAPGDSLAGTSNRVTLKVEYYNVFGGTFGTSDMIELHEIELADASSIVGTWESHAFDSTAPPGTVEARLAVVFSQLNDEGGAIYLDNASLQRVFLLGDFDEDGDVDAADTDAYVGRLGTAVPPTDAKFDLNGDNGVDLEDYVQHATLLLEWSNGGNGQSGVGTLQGDFNRDGVVSLLDLNTLGASFGSAGGWADGDTNGDGTVSLLDLNALGANFGVDVFAAPSTQPSVPEPASLVLLGVGGLALLRRSPAS